MRSIAIKPRAPRRARMALTMVSSSGEEVGGGSEMYGRRILAEDGCLRSCDGGKYLQKYLMI